MLILTATSGDTGKAALEGFGRTSRARRSKCFTRRTAWRRCKSGRWSRRRAATSRVCGVWGNFDDAQRACKAPFADNAPKAFLKLKVHTFVCEFDQFRPVDPTGGLLYLCLCKAGGGWKDRERTGDQLYQPTGNFGNILAGLLRKNAWACP